MALFFDQKWFNAQLEAAGLSKADLARALGLTPSEVDEMWKDQREIREREIGTMALLLGVSENEVRKRGGVQGNPEAFAAMHAKRHTAAVPHQASSPKIEDRLDHIEARLAKIEMQLKKEAQPKKQQ